MDESEKRKERLRAMRMEVDSRASSPSPAPPPASSTPPPSLPHPLQPPGEAVAGAGDSTPPPRFDFYTDPMSAFSSASKSRSGSGGQNARESFSSPVRSPMFRPSFDGSGNYRMTPPSHQFQLNQSLLATPSHQNQVNQSPDQSGYASWRSQGPFASPFSVSGATPVMNSGGWNGPGGSSGHGFPPNPRGGYRSPGFGRGGNPMNNSGRGGYIDYSGRGSPHSFSGRGTNWQSGGSSSPGRSGGRGRGFNGSARQETDSFYCKAMVEDPWRDLKPVVGNILVPRRPGFWLPKSLTTTKKARTEESVVTGPSSRSSLAESLALSFEEAIDETTN